MPFLVVTVEGALRAADSRFEEAAATLGASRLTVLRRVTLPMVMPSVAAGAVLCWARALGEFGATITFAGNLPGRTQTLPLAVYLELERDPQAAFALSLVLLAASVIVLVVLRGKWLPGRRPGDRRAGPRRLVAGASWGLRPRRRSHGAAGRGGGCPRPQRGRQVHPAAVPGRAPAFWSRGTYASVAAPSTTCRRRLRAAGAPPDRHRLPGLPPVPAPVRPRQRRLRCALPGDASLRLRDEQRRRGCSGWVCSRTRGPRPTASVGRPGATGRPGQGARVRPGDCCSSTSRSRRWMPVPEQETRSDLRTHLSSFAGPVLVVTHDALEAMVLADSLLVLEEGKVVQRGNARSGRPAACDAVRRAPVGSTCGQGSPATGDVVLLGGGHLVVADTRRRRRRPARSPSVGARAARPASGGQPPHVWPGAGHRAGAAR